MAGIGGRDVKEEDIEEMINMMAAGKEGTVFINTRVIIDAHIYP